MSVKSLIVAPILAVAVSAAPNLAAAQAPQNVQVGYQIMPIPARTRARIEIHPRPLLYRRCTDWYELQYRPSGTVLYPQMHCWWVRE
jgi:hypothetical protein